MKKIIFTAAESLLFIFFVVLCMLNLSGSRAELTISPDGSTVMVNTFLIIIAMYFIGLLSGIVYSYVIGERYKDKIEFYSRKNEKLAQQNEIDTDDKEVLQRKIATLEIALENALKNK